MILWHAGADSYIQEQNFHGLSKAAGRLLCALRSTHRVVGRHHLELAKPAADQRPDVLCSKATILPQSEWSIQKGIPMDIVQEFKNSVSYYQPTTDAGTWQQFYDLCWSKDYSTSNSELLKKVAYDCLGITSGADAGMWQDRAYRLDQFLTNNIGIIGDDAVASDILQYEFVACFLNDYAHAAHNNDLWQSFNDAAVTVLETSAHSSEAVESQEVGQLGAGYARWLMIGVPLILLNAIKTLNISVYRPTEDTDTWNYFQDVVFDLTILPNCSFTYRHAYLLRNISSGPDAGVWSGFSAGVQGFLQGNLGTLPSDAPTQKQLALDFCKMFSFNYQHAAHNASLFKLYNDTFADAATKIQLLGP